MNIESIQKEDCTGCMACVSACPNSCVNILEDSEGFLYPSVQNEKCSQCGKCFRSCPAVKDVRTEVLQCYAVTAQDVKVIEKSSSGGVFFFLAKYVIEQLQGYVCGAVLTEDMEVRHIIADNMEQVQKMQGSKYIQSNIMGCYEEIKRLCKQNRIVLFTGTPCQVAGVRALMKNEKNLLTVDLICHGVPNVSSFKKYFKRRYGDSKLISFRYKNPYEISTFAYTIEKHSGKMKRIRASGDPFYQAFMDGYSYRESCYRCQYASPKRVGDITIGDCGNRKAYISMHGKAISTVLINNSTGDYLWKAIRSNFYSEKADFEQEIKLNHQLREPVSRPGIREEFYQDLIELDLKKLKQKYCRNLGIKQKLKRFIIMHVSASFRWKLKIWLSK